MSEINVTPMVDVMLVLLIVFMVAAPLMTVGVPIDLPQTQARQMNTEQKPITVSVTTEGAIFLGDEPVLLEPTWSRASTSMAVNGTEDRIYVRGDTRRQLRRGDAGHGRAVGRRLSPRSA